MTDIEQKALALVNEVQEFDCGVSIYHVHNAKLLRQALCRAIERHEAFRQEVSDVVEQALSFGDVESLRRKGVLSRFIIPKPKPDPLVDIVEWLGGEWTPEEYAEEIRSALDARGFEIREKGQ